MCMCDCWGGGGKVQGKEVQQRQATEHKNHGISFHPAPVSWEFLSSIKEKEIIIANSGADSLFYLPALELLKEGAQSDSNNIA